ncbi:MAG TPA: hypothetical protein VMB22_00365 [Verrucomicrobiae bacterium]|nr:hypothetical protein [Verrucomicrobiae bacterium]
MTDETGGSPRRYKWPWFLLAAVIAFLALTIGWVWFAAHREEQERNFSAPISTGTN